MKNSGLHSLSFIFLCFWMSSSSTALFSQEKWDSWWVHTPETSKYEPGIYLYKLSFEQEKSIATKTIFVSADMRYDLFLNGRKLGTGPVPSSPAYWKYDSYELASRLQEGKNVLAAIVYYDGDQRSHAQMSSYCGFFVQEKNSLNSSISTPGAWMVRKGSASDILDRKWMTNTFDENKWHTPEVLEKAQLRSGRASFIHGLVSANANPMSQNQAYSSLETGDNDIDEGIRAASEQILKQVELSHKAKDLHFVQELRKSRKLGLASAIALGDDTFYKKLISDFHHSKTPEGLLLQHFPARESTIDPLGSLEWILMLHEYLYYGKDVLFVEQYLSDIEQVLQWFERWRDVNSGLLENIPYPIIVDENWDATAVVNGEIRTKSSYINLLYSYTLQCAASIFETYGISTLSESFLRLAKEINSAVDLYSYNRGMDLIRDYPGKEMYSAHTQVMAVLAGAIDEDRKVLFLESALRNDKVVAVDSTFNLFTFEALFELGLGNKLKEYGLNNHAESGSYISSFRTIAGLRSAEIGFSSIIIQPHSNGAKYIKGRVIHPKGEIVLNLKFDSKGGVSGSIELPKNLQGIFIWDGKTMALKDGKQSIKMKSLATRYKI